MRLTGLPSILAATLLLALSMEAHSQVQIKGRSPETGESLLISGNITVRFGAELQQSSITSSTVQLKLPDGTPVPASLTYYSGSLFSWPQVVINPVDELPYGTIYICELSGSLTGVDGKGLDGNNNGLSEGDPADNYAFSFATEVGPTFSQDVDNVFLEVTNARVEDLRLHKQRLDMWSLISDRLGDIQQQKDLYKAQWQAEGFGNPSLIFNQRAGSDLTFVVEGKSYHICEIQWVTTAGTTRKELAVLDQTNNLVSDPATLFKAIFTYENRLSTFDRSFLQANQHLLDNTYSLQMINRLLVAIRDAGVAYIFSFKDKLAVATSLIESYTIDFPNILQNHFAQGTNRALRANYEQALQRSQIQAYPMTSYADVSYYYHTELVLWEEMQTFAWLTDSLWKETGDWGNQFDAVLLGARDALIGTMADELLKTSIMTGILFKTLEVGIRAGSLIDDFFAYHDIFAAYLTHLASRKQFLRSQLYNNQGMFTSHVLAITELFKAASANLITATQLNKSTYSPAESATLTVHLAGNLTGAAVTFTLAGASSSCTDNGAGSYSKAFTVPSTPGLYPISITATKTGFSPAFAELILEVVQPGTTSFLLSLSSNKLQIGEFVTARLVMSPASQSHPINFASSNAAVLQPQFQNPILTDAGGAATATFKALALGTADITATDGTDPATSKSKNADVISYITINVGTSPAGRSFKVDGVAYSTPQTFQWQTGSFHTIYAFDLQEVGSNTKYQWQSWSNGGGISQVVSPTTSTTYTAAFSTLYHLTTIAGNGGDIDPLSGWYTSGTTVPVTANNHTFYAFSSWSGDLTGSTNPTTIVMTAPKTISASFASMSKSLSLGSSPASGVVVNVSPPDKNGISQGATPLTLLYDAGTVVTITAPASANGVPFEAWKYATGGSYSTSVTFQRAMSQDWSYTAAFGSSPPSDWSTIPSGTVGDFSSVKALAPGTLIAVGVDYNPANGTYDKSLVMKSTNGGSSWSGITVPNIASLYKVVFPSSSVGYIIGFSSRILKSINGGTTWTQISNLDASGAPNNLFFASAEIGFAHSGDEINKTTNGGSTWTMGYFNLSTSVYAVHFTSASTGYAVGYNGLVAKTTNGGSTWTEKTHPTTMRLYAVHFPSPLTGYAVGAGGAIVKTTDGGETWASQTSTVPYNLNDVAFADENNGYVAGNNDVLRTTDGGNSWVKQPEITSASMYGAAALSSASCVMVGDNGTIIRYTGSGLRITSPNGGEVLTSGQTYPITWSATNVSTVTLEYSTDNGTLWNPIQAGVNATTESLTWSVPNAPSSQCKIRIISETNAGTKDVSDNTFTIKGQPALQVVSPNGGERWIVGERQRVAWKSSSIDSISVNLSTDGGLNWSQLKRSVGASAQSDSIAVPQLPSTQCKIRLSNISNGSMSHSSQNTFTIELPVPEIPSLAGDVSNLVELWS